MYYFLECARLKQQVVGLQVEVPNLKACLDAAKEQILHLENQVQTQKLLQNQNQEAQFLIQGVYTHSLKVKCVICSISGTMQSFNSNGNKNNGNAYLRCQN